MAQELLKYCRIGHIEKVKHILKNENVNINIQDDLGNTALMVASIWGETEIVKYLLTYEKEDVNPNLQNVHGTTALMYASYRGYIEVVKLLLNYERKSVNPYLQDQDGDTALNFMYCENNMKIGKLLENYISFRKNIEVFIPSYNILLFILIREKHKYKHICMSMFKCKFNIPNEIILLIRDYGKIICGRETFR